jgi:hypothetical protein
VQRRGERGRKRNRAGDHAIHDRLEPQWHSGELALIVDGYARRPEAVVVTRRVCSI